MKLVLTLAMAVALTGLQAQQPVKKQKAPTPPPINNDPKWLPSKISPLTIASGADTKLAALRNVRANYSVRYWMGKDMYGGSFGEVKVRDNNTFDIQYGHMHFPKSIDDEPTHKWDLRANGKFASLNGKTINKKDIPVSTLRVNEARTAFDWVTGSGRYTLGGIHKEMALTDLVKAALRPGSGFTVRSGERTFLYGRRSISQSHIVIERTKAEAAKRGPVRIEVTIDQHFGLPVSARVDSNDKATMRIISLWTIGWRLNKATFTNAEFAPPGETIQR